MEQSARSEPGALYTELNIFSVVINYAQTKFVADFGIGGRSDSLGSAIRLIDAKAVGAVTLETTRADFFIQPHCVILHRRCNIFDRLHRSFEGVDLRIA